MILMIAPSSFIYPPVPPSVPVAVVSRSSFIFPASQSSFVSRSVYTFVFESVNDEIIFLFFPFFRFSLFLVFTFFFSFFFLFSFSFFLCSSFLLGTFFLSSFFLLSFLHCRFFSHFTIKHFSVHDLLTIKNLSLNDFHKYL